MKKASLFAVLFSLSILLGCNDSVSSSNEPEGDSSSSLADSSSSDLSKDVSSSSIESSAESLSSEASSSSVAIRSSSSNQLDWSRDTLFNPNISYGIMTDPRDGRTYRTVEVIRPGWISPASANGKAYRVKQTWMAENLNFSDSVAYPILKGNTRCYNDEEANCERYGRYYRYVAAVNGAPDCAENLISCDVDPNQQVQGICPDGWHIPSKGNDFVEHYLSDIDSLKASKLLRSMYGWSAKDAVIEPGLDYYGLSFIGAGFFTLEFGGFFENVGWTELMWIYNLTKKYSYVFISAKSETAKIGYHDSDLLFHTVRCIADKSEYIELHHDD
ncbi:MAG: hypothetical protein IKM81_07080 [Fibrobacter sp.]|nr:hypothetical protein [Fibrobacter sp.]